MDYSSDLSKDLLGYCPINKTFNQIFLCKTIEKIMLTNRSLKRKAYLSSSFDCTFYICRLVPANKNKNRSPLPSPKKIFKKICHLGHN